MKPGSMNAHTEKKNLAPVIAIDGSCEYLGLALEGPDGRRATLSFDSGLRHGEMMIPGMLKLLAAMGLNTADLRGVICSRGPGSFTGLRIGMATSRGLAEGLGIPLYAVSSLDAMAQGCATWPGMCLSLLDARKQRFYGGLYRKGTLEGSHGDKDLGTFLEEAQRTSCSDDKQAPLPLLIMTPHGSLVQEVLAGLYQQGHLQGMVPPVVLPTRPGCFWLDGLLDLGRDLMERGASAPDDEGPEYLRHSHEDLGIHISRA